MIVNLILLRSFKDKLMYKDDGNWFYHAIFKKRGLRTYSIYEGQMYSPICGIYTLSGIASYFYNLIGKNKYTFFNKFKMVLMALLSLSIYFVIYLVTQELIIAVIANLFFNLLFYVPKRAYYITYAENYQPMPVLFAFAVYKFAIASNLPYLLIFSGILISLSINWKFTGILHAVFFPLVFVGFNFLTLFKYYLLGLVIINLILPLFIFGLKRYKIYLMFYIRAILYYPSLFLPKVINNKISVFIDKNINQKIKVDELIKKDYSDNIPLNKADYVKQRQNKNHYNSNGKKMQFIEFFNDYYLMFVLSITTLIYGLINFNNDIFGLFILTMISAFMWYVQGGVNKTYFNLILPFVFVLFILGINLLIGFNLFGIILAGIIISLWIIKYWTPFYSEMKKMNSDIPTYPKKHTLYAKAAVEIGEYIKSKTTINDRIFVWGNMPVVYLYAERENVDFNFPFTYPIGAGIIHNSIKVLLIHLKRNPPKYFTFFQYIDIVDKWNMEKIQNEINIPYKLEKLYPIRDNKKEYHPIPLYVRDDKIYFEMLFERFRISKDYKYLKKILSLDPENQMAKFWGFVIKEKMSYKNALNYLKNREFLKMELVVLKIDLMKFFDKNERLFEYLQSLEVSENNYRILQEKGEYYFSRGEAIEAFEMFNKSKELNPYSAEIYNNLGVLSYSLEDFQSANFYLQKAIEIFPEYDDAKNNLKAIKNT
jgi:tetratricopeptide (TPR) repeat protein